MGSVTFPTRLGGSGVTISDDADPNTGLLNGGHRDRFVPGLQGVVDMASYVYQYAAKIDGAAEDAERAENARGYVEGYAAALRSNLRESYRHRSTIDFDFDRGQYSLDDGVRLSTANASEVLTVERASPKLVFGANGMLREIPQNTLAREWDPSTGQPRGAVIELESTNYATNSTNSGPFNAEGASWVSSSDVGGYRGMQLGKLVESTTDGTHRLRWWGLGGLVKTGERWVYSVFVKPAERTHLAIVASGSADFNFETGEFSSSFDSAGMESVGGGAWLVWVSFVVGENPAPGSPYMDLRLVNGVHSYRGDGNSGMFIGEHQLEPGARPTSRIRTATAPVTRARDIVYRDLGAEHRHDQGTLVLDVERTTDFVNIPLIKVGPSPDVFARGYGINTPSYTVVQSVFRDGNFSATSVNTGFETGERGKIAISFTADESWLVTADNAKATIISGFNALSNMQRLGFIAASGLSGSPGSWPPAIRLHSVLFIPSALNREELKELTA